MKKPKYRTAKSTKHTIPKTMDISEGLRAKILKNDFNIEKPEFAELEKHFEAVTNKYLAVNCTTSCVVLAYKVLNNWIKFHEKKVSNVPAKNTKVVKGNFNKSNKTGGNKDSYQYPIHNGVQLDKMKLKDLRIAYPSITDNKTSEFIKKVKIMLDDAKAEQPLPLMVIECQTQIILEGFWAVPVPEGMHRVLVLDPSLDVPENTVMPMGLFTIAQIAEMEVKIAADLIDTNKAS